MVLKNTKAAQKKRAKIVANSLLEGKTKTQALKDAGYSEKTAKNQGIFRKNPLGNPEVQETFAKVLNKAGLTDTFLANKIKGLCDFSKTQVVHTKNGSEIIEVADGPVQLGTVKLATQLKGHLVDRSQSQVSVSLEDILDGLED